MTKQVENVTQLRAARAAVLLLTIGLCSASAGSIPVTVSDLTSTGLNTDGTLIAQQSSDPSWKYRTGSYRYDRTYTRTAYVTDMGGFPFPPWVDNRPNSQWISPKAKYYSPADTDTQNQVFTYRTFFTLPTGYIKETAVLRFRFAVDNWLEDVRLNGVTTATNSSGPRYYQGHSGSGLDVGYDRMSGYYVLDWTATSGSFVNGVNTLDFITHNLAGTTGNPNGLNVQFDLLFASPVPEPHSIALMGTACAVLIICIRRRRGAARCEGPPKIES